MKRAVAIRHVSFEDLGSFAPVLRDFVFETRYVNCGVDDIAALDPAHADLLIVLGGPIGAYDDELYPFIKDEIRLIEGRLAAHLPTLGICLGAQMIARVLGARVYSGPRKEIGWSRLMLTDRGRESPLRHLSAPVLHWHGDTFELPHEATLLASTEKYTNQAFSWGNCVLALQFHPEVTAQNFEQWLIGHACEIAAANDVSVPMLRENTSHFAARLQIEGSKCFAEWLKEAFPTKIAARPHENSSTG
jgi:GMP synthase (glutamine-hydrolysing)